MPLVARYYAYDSDPSSAIKLETAEIPVPGPGKS